MADITKPVNTERTFTDKSSDSPTSYSWDFGDGSPLLYTKNAKHTYTIPGVYTIIHQVTGAGGTTTCTKTIEITPAAGIPVLLIGAAVVGIGGIIVIMSKISGGKQEYGK